MVVLGHLRITPLVLVLQDVVHALQGACFQLINLVVQYLQARDADNCQVVWGLRDLHAKGEGPNEYLRQLATRYKPNIALIVLLLARELPQNPQNHAHERAHDICFLQNACHLLVLASQLQLVLAQLRVQRHDIGVDYGLDFIDYLKQFLYANFHCELINVLIHQHEH